MTLRIYWTAFNLERASELGLKPRNLYSKQNVAGKGSNEFVSISAEPRFRMPGPANILGSLAGQQETIAGHGLIFPEKNRLFRVVAQVVTHAARARSTGFLCQARNIKSGSNSESY
jgi:hypothetical protein